MKDIKTVVLCGGKGLRFRSVTNNIPKPMAVIGEYPILVHIMNQYSSFGFKDFILCIGYLGHKIVDYFSENKMLIDDNDWNIEFVDTGLNTPTGSRIKMIEKYITEEHFFATYGDGVSDQNLQSLLEYHLNKNKIGTLTLVKSRTNFGIIKIDRSAVVKEFIEKPIIKDWINGGFFVFKRDAFDYMNKVDCILEKDTLVKLTEMRELTGFKHKGFWRCMDTYKDYMELLKIYAENGGFNNMGMGNGNDPHTSA